ncbi:Nucleoside-diphosphate-sugar epimerase [Actinacidiphila yanglinensis]|uniref:Nucleoside-diphosphate-sugar epimerase n=1 Tax=Actinacidiphila yanglinensis TaxID=310779 RepID=A0A1H6D9I9_9ACTN|nr:NAD-dependent epimerase/dehydratase family protein [Actinacidiphila yanglinensis]SEG81848.1 Nucleoside-diphosphate-sugar epimerase [Actinacidiphila yanglinensis]
MPLKVVVGAGATGVPTALLLAEAGHRVRLVSRRGTGPDHPGVETVRADATDTAALIGIARGAQTLYNCAMPPYDRWPELWPPLAGSLLAAASRTGADYVMVGNAYGYGPVDGPMTEDLPLAATTAKGRVRARMWQDAKAANDAGRVRATEVRAHDFLGPGAVSYYSLTVQPAVLAGADATFFPADLDAPHSWTYTVDTARTAVAAGESEASWGRAWHVPSTADVSLRRLTGILAEAAGTGPALVAMTQERFAALAQADPVVAEVAEMLYMVERPAVLDSAETRGLLGVAATPLADVVAEIVAHRGGAG